MLPLTLRCLLALFERNRHLYRVRFRSAGSIVECQTSCTNVTGRLTQLCCPRDDPAEDNSTECDDQNIPVVPDADSAWCGLQLQSSLCFLHPHPRGLRAYVSASGSPQSPRRSLLPPPCPSVCNSGRCDSHSLHPTFVSRLSSLCSLCSLCSVCAAVRPSRSRPCRSA